MLTPVELPEEDLLHKTFSLGEAVHSFSPSIVSVSKSEEDEEDEATPSAPTGPPLPFREDKFYDGYSIVPSYLDQYEKQPDTIKEGKLEARIFNLADPRDMEDYNSLLNKCSSPHSPQVRVVASDTMKHEGAWKVLVHYRYLWYKVLLPR